MGLMREGAASSDCGICRGGAVRTGPSSVTIKRVMPVPASPERLMPGGGRVQGAALQPRVPGPLCRIQSPSCRRRSGPGGHVS